MPPPLTLERIERKLNERISVQYYRGGSRIHTGTLLAVRELKWWERIFSEARFELTFGDPYPAIVWIEADAELLAPFDGPLDYVRPNQRK